MDYNLNFPARADPFKIHLGNNKIVMSLTDMKRVHSGLFFLYCDFAFDGRLVVNLEDARIRYKNYAMKFNFPGNAIHKDTLHIDGDANLLLVFSIPFNVSAGDTATLDFENFLRDETGREYKLPPVPLSVSPYIKPHKNNR